MLARKNQLHTATSRDPGLSTIERSRLIQLRTLALRRQDYSEVAIIDAQLEEANKTLSPVKHDGTVDLLAKVNERNRKANVDAVRRAELVEAERKKKERKLAAMNRGTPTPPVDPSARLKTVPRTFNPTSR